jgi:hypothetical protein
MLWSQMVAVDLSQVSDDAWIQAIVLIVTTCIAIGGAFLGARIGASATRGATKEVISAGRVAEERQREEAERGAIRALAAECRLNARLLREVPRPHEVAAPSPFLERAASDLALPVFHVLPPGLRERTELITADAIFLNALLGQRDMLSHHDVVDRAFDRRVEIFAQSLPDAFDDVASELENFAAPGAGANNSVTPPAYGDLTSPARTDER